MTPDVMALMVDEASGSEIVDDMMFVVARRPFDITEARVLEFAQCLVATLGARTANQSARYIDDRANDPDYIGASGARLARGRLLVGLAPVVFAAATIAIMGGLGGTFD